MSVAMNTAYNKLTRIGVFYDGNFFWHVSNYYLYHHQRRARINITGLHDFIRKQVAAFEEVDERYCQIVDAHYFRGRFSARQTQNRNQLYGERLFDDVLIREGVTTHYLPISADKETGIDVWFALEAFEQAIYKRFNVCALVASDGDYVPLARKLNTIGARVMVLGWDFKYVDEQGQERETRTSQWLLGEVTYPVLMSNVIEDQTRRNGAAIDALFVPPKDFSTPGPVLGEPSSPGAPGSFEGTIQTLREGYGFIVSSHPAHSGQSFFFFHAEVLNADFNDLKPGARVRFQLGTNQRGPCAVQVSVVQ
jgi:cold shock CspA family protein